MVPLIVQSIIGTGLITMALLFIHGFDRSVLVRIILLSIVYIATYGFFAFLEPTLAEKLIGFSLSFLLTVSILSYRFTETLLLFFGLSLVASIVNMFVK
ncbi:MAG: hypothetical protein Q8P52_01640 [bacterium]|nr:hypothetical protein [bacterium]